MRQEEDPRADTLEPKREIIVDSVTLPYTCAACRRRICADKPQITVIAPSALEPYNLWTIHRTEVCHTRYAYKHPELRTHIAQAETVADWEADGVCITPFSCRGEARLEVLESGEAA